MVLATAPPRMQQALQWKVPLALWPHLQGRLKRELDNGPGSFTTIGIERVGSRLEAGRSVATKSFGLAQNLVVQYAAVAGCTRPVPSNYIFSVLLKVLLDWYCVIGNYPASTEEGGEKWAAKKDTATLACIFVSSVCSRFCQNLGYHLL